MYYIINMNNTIQQAMSELLKSLGFGTMAEDVKSEQRPEVLRKYAAIIIKNSPAEIRPKLNSLLREALQ